MLATIMEWYYIRVVRVAWEHTWDFVQNEARWEAGFVIVPTAVVLFAFGLPESNGDALMLLSPLLGVGGFVVLMGIYQLVRAPVVMDREKQKRLDRFVGSGISVGSAFPIWLPVKISANDDLEKGAVCLVVPHFSVTNRTERLTELDVDALISIVDEGTRKMIPLESEENDQVRRALDRHSRRGGQLTGPISIEAGRRRLGYLLFIIDPGTLELDFVEELVDGVQLDLTDIVSHVVVEQYRVSLSVEDVVRRSIPNREGSQPR